jgi:protein gp37
MDCAVAEREACWAAVMAKRLGGQEGTGYSKIDSFKPTFHLNKLNEPLHWRGHQRVATCFMGDIACAKEEWIESILKIIRRTPQHRYYILTKQPHELLSFMFPHNVWLGVTVNRQKDIYRIDQLDDIQAGIHFGSFEPIYQDIELNDSAHYLDWMILGAQTHPEFQPEREWIEGLLMEADYYTIPVFMKDNLRFEPKRYDFPRGISP